MNAVRRPVGASDGDRSKDLGLAFERVAVHLGARNTWLPGMILLMFALPMIAGFEPASEAPGFRWKPSLHWLCKRQ